MKYLSGKRGEVSGSIPNPPYYLTKEDIQQLLEKYGIVREGRFRKHKGVGTDGFDFDMHLYDGLELSAQRMILLMSSIETVENITITAIGMDTR